MSIGDRPLSPHLGIHRWHLTMAMSILHRMTGVFLGLGAVLLVVWLVSVASGPAAFAVVTALLGSVIGQLVLFGCAFSFFYHLGNGVRHLFWDIGLGFDLPRTAVSGLLVIVFSLVTTLGFWLWAYAGRGV